MLFTRGHNSGRDSASTPASRRARASRLPALAAPYIGLIGGFVVFTRVNQESLAGLWWFPPGAALLYVLALLLTLVSMSVRRRRRRRHHREVEHLAERLRAAVAKEGPLRDGEIGLLMPRLRDMRRACETHLSALESHAVRAALLTLDGHDAVTDQLRRSRLKRRRADALFTLGWLRDARSVPVLAAHLRGRDPDLAYVAGQALSGYDSRRACGALVTALQNGALPRPLVATLLETSRCREAPELVAAVAGSADPATRSWVAFILGRCHDPRARLWLAPLASADSAEVRASAAEAHGSFPDPKVLERLLRDDDWRVRASAAKAVGIAGVSELGPNLTVLMSDPIWWVRQSAALALKQLGHASVDHLCRLLHDVDRFVRNKAAEILIEIGFISEQIAALNGTAAEAAAARYVLAAVVRAEARETLAGSVEGADPATRDHLVTLLEEVDSAGSELRLAA
jgi:HEAT repeat protein